MIGKLGWRNAEQLPGSEWLEEDPKKSNTDPMKENQPGERVCVPKILTLGAMALLPEQ